MTDSSLPVNQFNLSVRSAQKSETNVTMKEKFEACKDRKNCPCYFS